jgi:transcriptional antiterminator NusG
MRENWYILYALSTKQQELCNRIRNHGVNAFVPVMEYYRRDCKETAVKPMFPGYVFVRTDISQEEFDALIHRLGEESQSYIKQLKDEGTTAMTENEMNFFAHLLDEQGIAKMSYAHLEYNKAVVTDGPLQYFQDRIVKVDRHNRLAYLNFEFMNRKIQAGLTIQKKGAISNNHVLRDGAEINLDELKSKMMGL